MWLHAILPGLVCLWLLLAPSLRTLNLRLEARPRNRSYAARV